MSGRLYGDPEAVYNGCSIDSRKVAPGELFIALNGEQTDGHRYIPNALAAGAGIVLAESGRVQASVLAGIAEGRALIAVDNTVEALQRLAEATLKRINPVVVAVTGSCGKTTTKDMVAAVLAQKYRVHKNKANYNNELGLPLTILSSVADCEIMVLEMGMRGQGQIKALCALSNPETGVITNIGTTHMELLGSRENIARAKWELIDCLPANGTAILNADDYWSVTQAQALKPRTVFYGIDARFRQPDICAENIRPDGPLATRFTVRLSGAATRVECEDRAEVSLPLPGNHNVLDALAALAAGSVYGVPLSAGARALQNLQLSAMRLEALSGQGGSTVISDVYNANPDSMKASLRILAERGGGKTIAVLGEMYELGEEAVSGHREVGATVADLGISQLVTVGPLARHIAGGALAGGMPPDNVHECADCAEAVVKAQELIARMGASAWILVKGSRGMKMETISAALQEP